jgi:hypothetical protein
MIALRSLKMMKIVAGTTEPGRRGPQGAIFERVAILREVPIPGGISAALH